MNKKLQKLISITLFCALICLSLSHSVWAKNYFQRAEKAQNKGYLYQAIKFYKLELKNNPHHFESLSNLAINLFQVNEREQAFKIMHKLVKQYPFSLDANFNYAMMFKKAGHPQMAIQYFETCSKLRGDIANSFYQLSELYNQTKQFAKANHAFLKLITLDPENVSIRIKFADFLRKIKRYQASEEQYKIALSLKPSEQDILYNYALLLDQIPERINEAIDLYIKIIKQDYNFVPARLHLAHDYEKIKKYNEAEKQYILITEMKPLYYLPHVHLGLLTKRENKFIDAMKYFKKAISIDNKAIQPHEELAKIYFLLKKYDLAAKEYHIINKHHPHYINAYRFKAKLFNIIGNPSIANKEFEKIISFTPSDSITRLKLIKRYMESKHYNNAIPHLKFLLKNDKDNNEVRFYLGEAFFNIKKSAAAAAYLSKIDQDSQYFDKASLLLNQIYNPHKNKKRATASKK